MTDCYSSVRIFTTHYQGSYTFSQRNFQDFSRTFKDQINKNQGPLKLKKKPDYQTKQISKYIELPTEYNFISRVNQLFKLNLTSFLESDRKAG